MPVLQEGLRGRVVFVTGAGQGIGAALSRCLRADGALVAGCDLPEHLDEVAQVADLALACDVSDARQVEDAVARIVRRFGRIDGLLANAGIVRIGRLEDAPWDDLEKVVRVNLFGVMHCLRAVLPVMRAQNFGRIVAVTSRNAQLCKIGKSGYNASKAALVSLIGTVARELEGTDILANNLVPGPTATRMHTQPGARAPSTSYPTLRLLLSLPAGAASGRTFLDGEEIHILHPLGDALRSSLDDSITTLTSQETA